MNTETLELAQRRGTPRRRRAHAPQKYYLTHAETVRLKTLSQLWKKRVGKHPEECPDAIFHIGDEPGYSLSWTLGGRVPCFRRSMWRLWVASRERFMTVKEKYAALGFPVYSDLAAQAGVPVMPTVTGIACINRLHVLS